MLYCKYKNFCKIYLKIIKKGLTFGIIGAKITDIKQRCYERKLVALFLLKNQK